MGPANGQIFHLIYFFSRLCLYYINVSGYYTSFRNLHIDTSKLKTAFAISLIIYLAVRVKCELL